VRANKGIARVAAAVAAAALVVAMMATAAGAAGSVSPQTIGGFNPERPVVSGTRVVWSDFRLGRSELWVYDDSTKKSRQLTTIAGDKTQPAISGDNIVFVLFDRTTGADIYLYNLTSGAVRPLTQAAGDQTNPTISGRWVAWEDFGGGYSSKIAGYDLQNNTNVTVDGTASLSQGRSPMRRRPQAAGDVVVYESAVYGQQSNVLSFNFVTRAQSVVASSSSDERMPATDGRWVAWMQNSGSAGYNVMAKNLATGQSVVVAADPGEQSVPSVGNGVAYWVDMARGGKSRSMNLETGATSDFAYRTKAAMAGLSASGDSLAWLQQSQGTWRIKALFGAPVPGVSAASLLPQGPAWTAFRAALLPANGDTTAPVVVNLSVSPGQTDVAPDEPITVSFSEAMDPSTINEHNIGLVDSTTREPVPLSVRYSALAKTAVVTPTEPLAAGSYAVVVDRAVMDAAGNAADSGAVVAFSTSEVSALGIAGPYMLDAPVVRVVSANSTVAISWTPAGDDVAVTGYYVKRSLTATPPTATTLQADFSAATTLTPVGAGGSFIASPSVSATFAPAADENAKKSTYYYYVYAVDDEGNTSWSSIVNPRGANQLAIAPDPHGGSGSTNNTCMRCHGSVHGALGASQTYNLGALGARGAQGCYQCHGSSTASVANGYNSAHNIQAQFWDYASSPMPATGSRHGNAYIRAQDDNQQCDMCHSPHKRPYRAEAASSFGSLLSQPSTASDASSAALYSTDASPFGQSFCFTCHGSGAAETGSAPYAYMYVVGGTTAFDNSAGDHNQAEWGLAATAHGTGNVTDSARSIPNGGTKPNNPCGVCHNEHGSEAASLLDYRRSGVTTGLADNGALCLKCHGAGPEAGSPNNWTASATNGVGVRTVSNEFARTGSKHPISASAPTLQTAAWSQTSDSDFLADTLTGTEVSDTGSAAFARLTQTVVAPATGVLQGRVPTSDISAGGWTTAPLWSKIDEYPATNDADFVQGTSTTESQFGMAAFAVPSDATNIAVSVRTRGRDLTIAGANTFLVRWRTGTTWTSLPTHDPGSAATWTSYTDVITEPGNGVWTPAEVNAINGLGLDSTDINPNPQVSQLYIEVSYDTPGSTTYAASGSVVSPVISAPGTLNSWGELNADTTVPANSAITFDVLNPQAGDAVIAGYSGITPAQMPYSLAALSSATYPTLKVRAQLSGNTLVTSQLNDWSVSYAYTPPPAGSSTCYNCHNTHFVDEGTANNSWQVARVSNPQNTKTTSADMTSFCLGCHVATSSAYYNSANGSINITATVNQNTLIPYTVSMRAPTAWPFFTGWAKGGFTSSAHGASAATAVKCEACHDPHASNNPALTAWTRPATASWQVNGTPPAGSRANTSATGAFEENLCYKCHGSINAAANGRGLAAGTVDVYTPFQATYKHPVAAGSQAAPAHSDQESKSDLLNNRHAECADCHDPHTAATGNHTTASSVAGGVLRGTSIAKPTYDANVFAAPTGWATTRMGATDYEAYLCFKCHSSYLSNWSTSAPNAPSGGYRQTDIAAEFNPANASGHNVMGDSFTKAWTGGSAFTWGKPSSLTLSASWGVDSSMTCSDCHTYNGATAAGPHGSSNQYILKWGGTTDWYTASVTSLGGKGQAWSDNTATFFCGGCHTTESHANWMNRSDHTGRQCSHCHTAIPHGWKRPRMIVYTSDSAPYKVTTDGNLTGILRVRNITDDITTKSDCKDSCAGDHSGTGTYW